MRERETKGRRVALSFPIFSVSGCCSIVSVDRYKREGGRGLGLILLLLLFLLLLLLQQLRHQWRRHHTVNSNASEKNIIFASTLRSVCAKQVSESVFGARRSPRAAFATRKTLECASAGAFSRRRHCRQLRRPSGTGFYKATATFSTVLCRRQLAKHVLTGSM